MTQPEWQAVEEYEDITYEKADGVARIAISRPEVRNAFRPETLFELLDAFHAVNEDSSIGVVLLTGEGLAEDGKYAFCSGGDQRIRGEAGYVGRGGVPHLKVLQRLIRTMPKPVIAMVAGYAIGGGHVLHVVCDLTRTTPSSARRGPRSAASTAASARRISYAPSGRRRPGRSGIFAASTAPRRRRPWGW